MNYPTKGVHEVPYVDKPELVEMIRVSEFLNANEAVLSDALRERIQGLEKTAAEMRRQYEAGQADPEVLAEQNRPGSIVTNEGYQQLADSQEQRAAEMRRALEGLHEVLRSDESEDEE
ncbi:hypothetical protein [Streptomyces sp. NPDC059874]|uniref:hypothetical protein n=1 Tax=Streptomyces sp. NPDC059874 TaxID=3346983 RepID=UPI00365CF56C